MTGYKAEVVADSMSPDGVRLVSILASYPRFIHAEMLRHRVFSHSVASSRAIPTEKLIDQVREDPFIPETFNYRVKGMGVGEPLSRTDSEEVEWEWRSAANNAADHAERLRAFDVDKSRINRLLEPYLFVTDLITATEWSNFFALRDHPDAQPEFQKIARMMREVMDDSEPQHLEYGWWHLPFVTKEELFVLCDAREQEQSWKMASAGRCARVSYDKQGESEDYDRSIFRAQSLIESGHMSPLEHVARPLHPGEGNYYVSCLKSNLESGDHDPVTTFIGNFRGWVQMRAEIPNQHDFSKILTDREAAR